MKTAMLLAFVAISGGSAALAQSSAGTVVSNDGKGGYQTSTIVMTVPNWCPVSLVARQSGMTDMVKVKDGDKNAAQVMPGPRQRIHLVIGNGSQGKVVGATVTARGLNARSRMRSMTSDGSETSDVRRTLDLKFTPNEDGTVSTDLVLPGFTAVNSVKLESITFADGSTRDVSGKGYCRVAPDPVMLVADR